MSRGFLMLLGLCVDTAIKVFSVTSVLSGMSVMNAMNLMVS